jgi:hypothetical protein
VNSGNSYLQVQTEKLATSGFRAISLYPANRDIFKDVHLSAAEEAAAEEKKPDEGESLSQTETTTHTSSNSTSVVKRLLILYTIQP